MLIVSGLNIVGPVRGFAIRPETWFNAHYDIVRKLADTLADTNGHYQ